MRQILFPFILATIAAGHAQASKYSGGLPSYPALDAWFSSLESINLDDTSRTKAIPKSGTSCYLRTTGTDGVESDWLWVNTATNPETEIFEFNLARILNKGRLAAPGVRWTLHAGGMAQFKRLMNSVSFSGDKETNRRSNLAATETKTEMAGVYKGHLSMNMMEYEKIVVPSQNTLNPDHPLVGLIKVDDPMPSGETITVPIKNVSARETNLELAKQLSTILVVDALSGQWDRFSGGNFHIRSTDDGRAQLLILDNGGASIYINSKGEDPNFNKYILGYTDRRGNKHRELVSRFDREDIKILTQLSDFIKGSDKVTSMFGYDSASELLSAMGLSDASKPYFATKLAKLLTRVHELEARYQDKVYF